MDIMGAMDILGYFKRFTLSVILNLTVRLRELQVKCVIQVLQLIGVA